jgi:cobyrinic acid a,c-diamide synthase
MRSSVKGLLIAGTHSGVGKTTVATGLMAALRQKGHKVQPFKVGPDYIDPSYHEAACGLPSRNLDSWLLEAAVMKEFFHRAMTGKDLAIVEGVMGLYDGFRGDSEEGSTAQVAKLLGLPVILVLDASAAARSVGAAVLGFKEFDPEVNLAGLILNGIAGEKHLEFIKPSLAKAGVPLLGYLPRNRDIALPERHLGLVPNHEGTVRRDFYDCLAKQVGQTIDIDGLLALAAPIVAPNENESVIFPRETMRPKAAIAVAMDKAFNFYYADSLDLLRAWGAEIVPFSPLEDRALLPSVAGVYIGGGFPELYARELSDNDAMHTTLRSAALRGMPVYAECGGLMYLGDSIEDGEGREFRMVGVLPCRSSMKQTRLTLGYRQIEALDDGPLLKRGESVRGHEFHLSALKERPDVPAAYRVLDQDGRYEGFRMNNVLASYIHLHLGSKRNLARDFVNFCTVWRETSSS